MALEHAGNIVLAETLNDTFQNIYASQNYGTFFGVFGKFKFNKTSKKIQELTLQIINYKGLINLEFVDYSLIQYENAAEDNIIELSVSLKGSLRTSGKEELSISQEDLNALDLNAVDYFIINKSLKALNGDSQEEVDARVMNGSNQSDLPLDPMSNGVFDEEFYYRNGKLIDKISMNDNRLPAGGDLEKDGSPSCKQRISVMHIM